MPTTLKTSRTIAILYGLAEGPVISRVFRQTLAAAGFILIQNPAQADIIIAHSGGCLYLPRNTQNKTILLVAPSYGRRRSSLLGTQLEKVWHDGRYHLKTKRFIAWLYKCFWNTIYLLIQPRRLTLMWSAAAGGNPSLPTIVAQRVIAITYRDDPWSGYISASEIHLHPTYQFIEHEGVHDDLWLNPQPYIEYIVDKP